MKKAAFGFLIVLLIAIIFAALPVLIDAGGGGAGGGCPSGSGVGGNCVDIKINGLDANVVIPFGSAGSIYWVVNYSSGGNFHCLKSASPPNPNWSGLIPVSGFAEGVQSTGAMTSDTVFTLGCQNPIGVGSYDFIVDSVNVIVRGSPPPPLPPPPPPPPSPPPIVIDSPTYVIVPSSTTINQFGSATLRGLYDPDGPSGPAPEQDRTDDASWTSDLPSVATVSNTPPKGIVTGQGGGTTIIRSVYNGIEARASVNVIVIDSPTPPPPPPSPPPSPPSPPPSPPSPPPIVIDSPTYVIVPPSTTINQFGSATLQGLYDPDGPSGPAPEENRTDGASWTSDLPSVATVSNTPPKGIVTGQGGGTTIIRSVYNGIEARASVTVNPSAPTLTILPASAEVARNETRQFTALYDPDGLSGPASPIDVTFNPGTVWSSDNPAVASVDATGLVRGNQSGTTSIRSTYSGTTGSSIVTVTTPFLRRFREILPRF